MRRLLIVVLLLSPALFSQDHSTRAAEDALQVLSSVSNFYEVAIAPDGTHVAWAQGERTNGKPGIYVASLHPSQKPIRISAAPESSAWENSIAWSPDSKQIVFLSDAAGSGQQQLYIADVTGGAARKLTSLTGFLSSPAWSPDGGTLSFLFIENAPRAAGPLQPMTPPSGVIEQHIYEQRLNLVDAAGGAVRAISPPDMYVYEYDWAPDGGGFVISAARGDGDNNWWIAQLYALSIDGKIRSVYKPALQIANPRFSPDGKNIALIEGLMSDQGVTGGDVVVIPAGAPGSRPASEGAPGSRTRASAGANLGSSPRNLTPNMSASATWLAWTDNQHILFSEIIDGNSGVASVDTNGNLTQLWSGSELMTAGNWEVSLSLARDGRQSAVIRSSPEHPPEVWAGPIGSWSAVTDDNRNVRAVWGEVRSVHWQSDNLRVQGWLLMPRAYSPSKHYPLVVNVHGGPASACIAGWPGSMSAPLAAAGYFVLCPNPRGSYGQGESFTQGNVKDLGGGDLRDIMAGVDEVLREYPVDPARLGIHGWSYGGYMTMWAETQTHRFSAAVAGAGISNWLSYYGQNDIDQWLIPYFGASVYDDGAVYAKSEPIKFVKNVKTPTLILVGDRDGECPAPQSFEWWHALKNYDVPVQFVVYPNEGHMIQQSEHRRDIVVRSLEWFDRWLGNGKSQAQTAAAQ
jgi:dipeptidyl aminopeptidase/acylaminoacyl peptidase